MARISLHDPLLEPVEPGMVATQVEIDVNDLESEQTHLFFAAVWGGDAARLIAAAPTPMQIGTVTSLVGFIPIDLSWLRRWIWMWEQERRAAELRERIRAIVDDRNLSGEEKTRRIRELLDAAWDRVARPLGPDGLHYDATTQRRYLKTTRGPTRPPTTHADLSTVLRDSATAVLRTVVNATLGAVLAELGVDIAEVVATGTATFIDKLAISGNVHVEATWSQLWVYPADKKEESRRLIDAKKTPARKVAVRVANAADPDSFGAGDQLGRIGAELGPVLNLVTRLLREPKKLALDVLTGKFDPTSMHLPDPHEIASAVSRLISGIENLAEGPGTGMTCPPTTRTTNGNRTTIKRACARTIYFGLLSGPDRPVVGPAWPGAIEIHSVALINAQVLPQTSEVFLEHHGLFYTGSVEASFRTDLQAVLKEALEATARAMLDKAIDQVKDALKSAAVDRVKAFWDWLKSA